MIEKFMNIEFFYDFKIIGSYKKNNSGNDIDYLVILNDSKCIEGLNNLIENLSNFKNNYSIISDSYFLPYINQVQQKPVLHVIFYYSKEAFEINNFSHLINNNIDNLINLPSKSRLSIILAIQDVIKYWLLLKCNNLKKVDIDFLYQLIFSNIDKWLNNNVSENIQENERKIIGYIENDYKRISY